MGEVRRKNGRSGKKEWEEWEERMGGVGRKIGGSGKKEWGSGKNMKDKKITGVSRFHCAIDDDRHIQ
jgi:hypothetical protein